MRRDLQIRLVLLAVIAAALAFVLPDISLDGAFADAVVRLTDTADITGLPWLLLVALVLAVSRPGLTVQRRATETAVLVVAMLIVAIAITVLNENGLKPLVASPRPNLQAIAESGQLGPEYPDAETLYGVGDKQDRRDVLEELIVDVTSPNLSTSVRDHWAHETGYSFPSGHSISAATFASAIATLAWFWLGGWRRSIAFFVLPVWAVLIAYTRVLLEVHRPIDVVVGAAIGVLFGTAAGLAIRRVVDRLVPGEGSSQIR